MTYFVIPSRRLRQPQGALALREQFATAAACVYAPWLGPLSAINNPEAWTTGSGTPIKVISTAGAATYFAGDGRLHSTEVINAYPYTVLAVFSAADINTDQTLFSSGLITSNSARTQFDFVNGAIRQIDVNSSAGSASSVAALVAGKTHVGCGVSYAANSRAAWLDGANKGADTTSISLTGTHNQSRISALAKNDAPLAYLTGNINFLIALRIGLNDAQCAEATRFPYQFFFVPDVRRIYFGAGATGGGAYEIDAQPGGYAVNGTAATLARGLFVNAQPGAYAVNGTAATLARGYYIDAQPGTYAVNGTAATLARGLVVNAGPGALTLTGTDATLEKVTPGVYTIDAQPGSFALTGIDATLTYTPLNAYTLDAQPATFTISGTAATLVYAGSSIWTDVGVSSVTWSDVGGATSIWSDL